MNNKIILRARNKLNDLHCGFLNRFLRRTQYVFLRRFFVLPFNSSVLLRALSLLKVKIIIYISFCIPFSFPQIVFAESENSVFFKYENIWIEGGVNKVLETKNFLTLPKIKKLYDSTIHNEVAQLGAVSKYDKEGVIGFCFGRAMAAQLGARLLGLKRSQIKKLFIIGSLCSKERCPHPGDAPEWRFHVTTIVPSRDSKGRKIQYALDPIYYASHPTTPPPTVAQWIEFVRNGWDTYHGRSFQSKIYLVKGDAIIPDIRVLPEPESGQLIVEFNFDPKKNKINLIKEKELNQFGIENISEEIFKEIYYLNKDQDIKDQGDLYFLTTDEKPRKERFNFLEIKVNDIFLSYNFYFRDLLFNTDLSPDHRYRDRERHLTHPRNEMKYHQELPLGMNIKKISLLKEREL